MPQRCDLGLKLGNSADGTVWLVLPSRAGNAADHPGVCVGRERTRERDPFVFNLNTSPPGAFPCTFMPRPHVSDGACPALGAGGGTLADLSIQGATFPEPQAIVRDVIGPCALSDRPSRV
ncbi:hypothetical protein GCM10009416_01090 [Craurococcus roseus]|uniref:Uncharacterized protein n=1 Tax=Craurococcus roseus TaxID=77585 RepID=A0ABN1EJE6_9PROT